MNLFHECDDIHDMLQDVVANNLSEFGGRKWPRPDIEVMNDVGGGLRNSIDVHRICERAGSRTKIQRTTPSW